MNKITWTTDNNGVKWASDDKGNKCSVRYFGSEATAPKKHSKKAA